MKHRLYCVDNMEFWCSDESAVFDNCATQHDVFMFDADDITACCEASASYCMDPFYGAFHLKDATEINPDHYGEDPELLRKIKAEVTKYQRTDCMYLKASKVDAMPHFKRGELPDRLPKEFVIIWDDGPFEDPDYETMDSFMSDVEGDRPL